MLKTGYLYFNDSQPDSDDVPTEVLAKAEKLMGCKVSPSEEDGEPVEDPKASHDELAEFDSVSEVTFSEPRGCVGEVLRGEDIAIVVAEHG